MYMYLRIYVYKSHGEIKYYNLLWEKVEFVLHRFTYK